MILTTIGLMAGGILLAKKAYLKAKQNKIKHLTPPLQHKQKINSSKEDPEKDNQEKKLNQSLTIALGSIGVAVSGYLFYPPLILLSLPGVIINSQAIFSRGFNHLRKQHAVSIDVLNMLLISVFIVSGHYVLSNIPTTMTAIRRKLVAKVKNNSQNAIINVFKQQPHSVWVFSEGVEIEMSSTLLEKDHIVIVHAGETIPVDGIIISGTATIDQHILTGESQPIEKSEEDNVFAMTVVLTGYVHIRIEKTGEDTTASQIGNLLNQTVDIKTDQQIQVESLVDKAILPTLAISVLSFPFLGISAAGGILNTLPRDNITIAGAVGILNYLNITSKEGILIKDGRVLELLNHVDTVVFDKTGTLTETQPHIEKIHAYDDFTVLDILSYAAAAEYKQTHPIAKAILQEAKNRQLIPLKIDKTSVSIGYGLKASIQNKVIHIGSERFMIQENIFVFSEISEIQTYCSEQGYSLVLIAIDNKIVGAIELHPTLRKETKSIINRLQADKKSIVIISGDHQAPTQALAKELGVDRYYAETLPKDKAKLIKQLQEEGKTVCFIGDGINDAIAIKNADVGISLRGASSVATDTAQVILMDGSLKQLCRLFELAGECKKKLHNTYSIIFIPPLIAISGVLFLHVGFFYTVIINQLGFLTGIANVSIPLLKHHSKRKINDDMSDV
jgi:Cu2+-exporting ATPase